MSPDNEMPSGLEKQRFVQKMFDSIAPRYDFMNRMLTFGMDVRWRRSAVRALNLLAGSSVIDVGCGTGDLCRELQLSGLKASGFDFSSGMLSAAKTSAPLALADALALPVAAASVDGAISGFTLRNVSSLEGMLTEMARVLRPGGRLVLLETAEPQSALARALHRLYFHKVVPFVGGLLSDRRAYRWLPESWAYLPATEQLLDLIRRSGFDEVSRRTLGFGAAQLITGVRK